MKTPFQRALQRSALVHGVLILLAVLWPLLSTLWQNRRPKPEEIVLIELKSVMTTPRPQVARPVEEQPPEPKPPQPPKPPEPPKEIKEPIKDPPPAPTNVVKKPPAIKLSTTKVDLAKLKPPKSDPGPKLTDKQIRDLIAAGIPVGDTTSLPGGGQPSLFSAYYLMVRGVMYDAWQQPASLAGAGLVAQVRIRVTRDGTITSRTMVRRSGHALMDDSVMQAVNRVSRLRPLPSGFTGSYKDITVDFELTGTGF